jgi:hypothetical protein
LADIAQDFPARITPLNALGILNYLPPTNDQKPNGATDDSAWGSMALVSTHGPALSISTTDLGITFFAIH